MSEYRIETGVPITEPRSGGESTREIRRALELLAAAKVGASVFFPNVKSTKINSLVQVYHGSGWSALRTITESGVKGVRIWKTSEPKRGVSPIAERRK